MTHELALSVALLTDATPAEEMLLLRGRIDVALAKLRELREQLDKEHLLPALKARGGIEVAGIRYWVGHTHETKPVSVRDVVEALWKSSDVDGFMTCLRSDPFKPSECKKVLPPDVYYSLFTTTTRDTLKDGKPAPAKLQSVPTQFVEIAQ